MTALAFSTTHRPTSLVTRIEQALAAQTEPLSTEALAALVESTIGRVGAHVRAMLLAKRVYNLGSDTRPAWLWIVGDATGTTELYAAVRMAIGHRPMLFAELLDATGARRGRVSGAIVDAQKDMRRRVRNFGTANVARWFLMPR